MSLDGAARNTRQQLAREGVRDLTQRSWAGQIGVGATFHARKAWGIDFIGTHNGDPLAVVLDAGDEAPRLVFKGGFKPNGAGMEPDADYLIVYRRRALGLPHSLCSVKVRADDGEHAFEFQTLDAGEVVYRHAPGGTAKPTWVHLAEGSARQRIKELGITDLEMELPEKRLVPRAVWVGPTSVPMAPAARDSVLPDAAAVEARSDGVTRATPVQEVR